MVVFPETAAIPLIHISFVYVLTFCILPWCLRENVLRLSSVSKCIRNENSFLCSFSLGRKYLAWKAESEMRALQQRYEAVSLELAQLGNEISKRKGFMKDASRS